MRVTQIWCYFCQWRISDEKTLDKLKLRLLVQNDWPVTFKRVKEMEVKNRSRNCSRYMITNATHGSEWNLFVIRDIIWTGETRIGSEDRQSNANILILMVMLWLCRRLSLFTKNAYSSFWGKQMVHHLGNLLLNGSGVK